MIASPCESNTFSLLPSPILSFSPAFYAVPTLFSNLMRFTSRACEERRNEKPQRSLAGGWDVLTFAVLNFRFPGEERNEI